jgi:hypothetical protein
VLPLVLVLVLVPVLLLLLLLPLLLLSSPPPPPPQEISMPASNKAATRFTSQPLERTSDDCSGAPGLLCT